MTDEIKDSASPEENTPPKRAIALEYDPEKDTAPKVVAVGRGAIAEKILEIAKQNNLPVRDDPVLADALAQVDLYEVIPPELYAVVAEVFAFVYRLRQKKGY